MWVVWFYGFEKEERLVFFEYSYDGVEFIIFELKFVMMIELIGFVGYWFVVFNYVMKGLGGKLIVKCCDIREWED